jgi:hypothetical protein
VPANAVLESIIVLIMLLPSPYDAYHQFALAALRDMRREGRPEMGLFAMVSMIIDYHLCTFYDHVRFGRSTV